LLLSLSGSSEQAAQMEGSGQQEHPSGVSLCFVDGVGGELSSGAAGAREGRGLGSSVVSGPAEEGFISPGDGCGEWTHGASRGERE